MSQSFFSCQMSAFLVLHASRASFLLLLASTAAAQDSWRVATLDLDVSVEPTTRVLGVRGTMRLQGRGAGPTLVFGPNGVVFDSASVNLPAELAYSAARDTLRIRPRSPATDITLTFHAHSDRELGRSPIRMEGAMISWGAQWYPMVAWMRDSVPEFESTGSMRITVPARWRTLASGALADSIVHNGKRTETWRADRPMARSFVAAEFIPAWATVGSARVAVYLLPRHASRMQEYATAIPKMVEHLVRYFGPYPFATFGIAELPRAVAPPGFGGRSEPGYFIAHTDALEVPGVNVWLAAHELTHMWFPNAVDSRPPGDDMMDEAIASYGVPVYFESIGDSARARSEIVEGHPDFSMRAYFHEIRRGGVDEPLMADYSPMIARAKGFLVYDMLRRRVGDEVFFGVWRDLAARGGSASLADLRRMYLERAPRDTGLRTFLAQWMDRTGAPIVDATWNGSTVTLVQRGALYALDIPVRIRGTRRTLDTTLSVSRLEHRYVLPKVGAILAVELDPRDHLLLWKPRFGPPPHVPASWGRARWERWMADEVAWLMKSYDVRGVSVVLRRRGAVAWTSDYGNVAPSADARDDVTLAVNDSTRAAEVTVVAHGGWGGRQLTMHVAQRVAIQERWSRVPR
jgi:aminopeptidase N